MALTTKDINQFKGCEFDHGFGYLHHEKRTPELDKVLIESANRLDYTLAELGAFVMSRAGRHLCDETTFIHNDGAKLALLMTKYLARAKKSADMKEFVAEVKEMLGESKTSSLDKSATQLAQVVVGGIVLAKDLENYCRANSLQCNRCGHTSMGDDYEIVGPRDVLEKMMVEYFEDESLINNIEESKAQFKQSAQTLVSLASLWPAYSEMYEIAKDEWSSGKEFAEAVAYSMPQNLVSRFHPLAVSARDLVDCMDDPSLATALDNFFKAHNYTGAMILVNES